jgi:hemoglobin/transferrin/lactoferrin receptor protein
MKQYILLLFVLWVSFANAQTVTVLDMSSRRPIESVQVSTSTESFMALTDADGLVRLSDIPEGTTIYFTTIGYVAVAITLDSIQKNPVVKMRTKSYDMDEVVISASRFEESKRDVAQSISVITKSDIDYANQRSSADLLESTGDVFVQRSQF